MPAQWVDAASTPDRGLSCAPNAWAPRVHRKDGVDKTHDSGHHSTPTRSDRSSSLWEERDESRVKTRFSLLFQQVLGLTGIVKRLVFYHGMHLSSLLNNGSAGESARI